MSSTGPVAVHPDNPHYFIFDGKPLVLISSGDIYYDIFSLNQDFQDYLDTLSEFGSNFTRIYPAGCTAFVPADGENLVLPWVRRDDGRYDLDAWNEAYFDRLHSFMSYARERKIIIDACLFNGFTTSWQQINNFCWPKMPLNASNNVQAEGSFEMNDFTSLRVASNVARQKDYVRKLCRELQPYDNLIYDTSDEPDCLGTLPLKPSNDWVEAIISTLHEADGGRHLIAQTHYPSLEKGGKDWCRDPRVSWTNAEYLIGLRDLPLEYSIGKPHVMIETFSPGEHPAWKGWWSTMGLVMSGDLESSARIHAWAFMLGGGAGFLEWSAHYHPGVSAGSLQRKILRQKRVLADFVAGLDIGKMYRFDAVSGPAQSPTTEPGLWCTAIAEPGRQYAVYMSHSHAVDRSGDFYNGYYTPDAGNHRDEISLDAPASKYRTEWIEPATGSVTDSCDVEHNGGRMTLESPFYEIDIALRVVRA